MKAQSRPAVAAIAAALANGKAYGAVYDHAAGGYVRITARVVQGRVEAYDHQGAFAIGGPLPDRVFNHGEQAYLTFGLVEGRVEGFDYKSNAHYSATVTGDRVYLYDYESSAYHQFSVAD